MLKNYQIEKKYSGLSQCGGIAITAGRGVSSLVKGEVRGAGVGAYAPPGKGKVPRNARGHGCFGRWLQLTA